MTRRRMLTAFERVSRATTPTSNARKNTCLLLFSPFTPLVPLFSWLSSNCKKVHRLLHVSVCAYTYGHDTSRFMENVTRVVAFQFWLHFFCISRDLAVSINCVTVSIERSMETEESKKMKRIGVREEIFVGVN